MKLRRLYLLLLFGTIALKPAMAMHIMECYLPLTWCVVWYLIALPFVIGSYRVIKKELQSDPRGRVKLSLNAAFVFILSALKLPSVTGSSSHLTGTTLGTLSTGPMSMPLLGLIVLIFQALLLAHGGISTLGANVFSMAVAGPFVADLIYKAVLGMKGNRSLAIFLAAFLGSLSTYVVTSVQLALVYPDPEGGILSSMAKFMGIFAVTQVPLSLLEGAMTLGVIKLLERLGEGGTLAVAKETAKSSKQYLATAILTIGAFICLLVPVLGGYFDFGGGTDDGAGALAEKLDPTLNPEPFFTAFEPSEALEPWLFALQVLIGVLLFVWAFRHFSKKK